MDSQHLWREVVESTAHGLPTITRRMDRPTKVADLDLVKNTDKDVLGFDIAIHDVLLVEILQH